MRAASALLALAFGLPILAAAQPFTPTEAARIQKECSMRAQVVAGITSRHDAYVPKAQAEKEMLDSVTRFRSDRGPVILKTLDAKLWVVRAVDRVYAMPRSQPGTMGPDFLTLQEVCMNNPDLYATPSIIDWPATEAAETP